MPLLPSTQQKEGAGCFLGCRGVEWADTWAYSQFSLNTVGRFCEFKRKDVQPNPPDRGLTDTDKSEFLGQLVAVALKSR